MVWSLAPEALAETIECISKELIDHERKVSQQGSLYVEKREGFQCGTCRFATPVNGTHGKCAIVAGTIHLTEGCCVLWSADEKQLHLYKTPQRGE